MCLMVQEEEKEEVSTKNFSDFSFEKLLDAFYKLMHDSTSLAIKVKEMKVMHKELNKKLDESISISKSLKSKRT